MEELREWEAYNFFEPFGAPAEDDRWRQMYSLYFSANTKPGTTMPDWLDHDPTETKRLRELANSSVTLEDKLMAFINSVAVYAEEPSPDVIVVEIANNPPSVEPTVTVPYLAPAPFDASMKPTA
ncbi:hypothetical protein [Sphingomonas sp. NFX23]|uniref:hypothetical protein n=1 Tax=Sphingomonas sp. NFX23 TaxID=2819532 RepID=UPI003CF5E9C0